MVGVPCLARLGVATLLLVGHPWRRRRVQSSCPGNDVGLAPAAAVDAAAGCRSTCEEIAIVAGAPRMDRRGAGGAAASGGTFTLRLRPLPGRAGRGRITSMVY